MKVVAHVCGSRWGIGVYDYVDENGERQEGYGFFTGANPNHFQPDYQCCSEEEIRNWELDKLMWNAKTPDILIIAERPKTEVNVAVPMLGTRSWDVLSRWLKDASIIHPLDIGTSESDGVYQHGTVKVVNATKRLVGKPTAFDVLDVRDQMREVRFVVTLGNVAADVALQATAEFPPGVAPPYILNLPHPSGLNRKLNSKKAKLDVVRKLQYLNQIRTGKVES